jgi:hypothetical protein
MVPNREEIDQKTGKNRRNIILEKKYHTVKHLCITDKSLCIRYTSKHYPGRIHDKTIFEQEAKKSRLPDELDKLFDPAFYGLGHEYKNVILPQKKPK